MSQTMPSKLDSSPVSPDNAVAPAVMQAPKGELSAVGWAPGRHMAYEDWLRLGARLGVAGRGAGWWLGDWLRFGTARYGSKYTAAVRVTGYDRQTLMNMVYVAARFPVSRRREKLSWSHHAELAGLDVHDQERWLERAALERMSVRELRQELLSERRGLTAAEARCPDPADPAAEPAPGESPADAPREPLAPVRDAGPAPSPRPGGNGEILVCPHCGCSIAR